MLVLKRREGEELVINDTIRVVVKKISGKRVTLAIIAPQEVVILRSEVKKELVNGDSANNG